MGAFDVKRVGITLATVGALLGAVLTVSLNADAVAVSPPVYQGGELVFTITIEDPDHVAIAGLMLHFDCEGRPAFSEEMDFHVGSTTYSAELVDIQGTASTGYGYFQAGQTGYGYSNGQHGYETGNTDLANGYGYGYSEGYGYGYGSGNLVLTIRTIASAFVALETCTLVVEVLLEGGVTGDFESPASAPFVPRQPPTADAGIDQNVPATALVTLDGTASVDPDALPGPLAYTWSQLPGGTQVTLVSPSSATPSFTAPDVTQDETLTFELLVSDTLDTASDQVSIFVHAANNPPIAVAGADLTADEGTVVALDGSASSDPDQDTLSFSWVQTGTPAVTLQNANTATPSFTAPLVDADTQLTFTLTVSDGVLESVDSVTVTVLNTVPTVNAGPDRAVNEGAVVTLTATAFGFDDPNNLTFTWSRESGPSVTLNATDKRVVHFTAPAVDAPSTLVFKVSATDLIGTAVDFVTITVNPIFAGQPHVAHAGPDQMVYEGTQVQLDGEASYDPDGTPLTYSWSKESGPSVTLSSSTAVRPTFTAPPVDGGTQIVFRLDVRDGDNTVSSDLVNVLVRDTSGFAPREEWYLHSTGCLAEDVPLVGGKSTRSATPFNSADREGCIQTTIPVLSDAAEVFPATPTAFNYVTGNRVTGTLYLSFLLPDPTTAAPVLDGVQVQVTVRKGTAALGTQTVTIASDTLLLNLLGDDYIPVPLNFPLTNPLGAGDAFTFEVHIPPTVGLAYVIGYEGNHASRFAMTGSLSDPGTPNLRPIAEAGPTQSVHRASTVTLDGTESSDADGLVTGFAWTQVDGPRVVLDDPTAAQPTFVAPTVTSAANLYFRLQVSDGHLTSITDDVHIVVRPTDPPTTGPPANQPPVARAGADQSVKEGVVVVLDGTASSDTPGTQLTFEWVQTSGTSVALNAGNDGVVFFTAPQVDANRVLVFRLNVTDPDGLTRSDTVSITVLDVPPVPADPDAGVDGNDGGQGSGTGTVVPPSPCLSVSTGDLDGDGFSDRIECKAGSDPADPASGPQYELTNSLVVERGATGNVLSWPLPDAEVLGFQVWASNSPYALMATLGADTTQYNDTSGTSTTKYKLTYFVENSAEGGRFANAVQAASLTGWVNDAFNPTANEAETVSPGHVVAGTLLAIALVIFLVAMVGYAVSGRKSGK